MGWGIVGDAFDAVSDAAGDVVDTVADAGSAVVDTVSDGLSSAWDWTQDHWKDIAIAVAATVVFVGVTALTGGLGAAPLLAFAAGGFASGVAGYGLSSWLYDTPFSVQDALLAGATGAVVSAATFGVARYASPALAGVGSRAASTTVVSAVPAGVRTGVTNAAAGAAFGSGFQAASNVVAGRPVSEGVGDAAIVGGLSGAATGPLTRFTTGGRVPAVAHEVDPVTRTVMTEHGLTPDTIVYRVTDPRYVDTGAMTITGNPRSMALVQDPYAPRVPNPLHESLPPVRPTRNASELGPSLNVAVRDPARAYADPGSVRIGIRLGDVLDRGGRIYPDVGAGAQLIDPLIIAFDGTVPVAFVEPVAPAGPSTPSATPGILGSIDR
ncbi:MAG: AvrPphF family type III effector [Planctomycetota bacterium]